ncbi:MAG: peptidoglycan/LPS O-acetylase OafA/YrhL [Pseudomonadales bacterium]|jgi:peptidoglycan/LPS O-acetylase OafA/YrhL
MMIMATAIILSKHDVFPGYNALWPTLSAAMFIYAGLHHKNTFVGVLLASSMMVFFGRISYSLYLWHWPPVAIMHYQLIEITLVNTLISIVLVILIA